MTIYFNYWSGFLKVLELTSNVLVALNLLIVEVLLHDHYLFQLLIKFSNKREMIVYMPFVDEIKSFPFVLIWVVYLIMKIDWTFTN